MHSYGLNGLDLKIFDIVKDIKNGFFIEDSNELAEKIIFLLNNPQKIEKMGEESLKMVQKFSWEHIIKSIIDQYKTI